MIPILSDGINSISLTIQKKGKLKAGGNEEEC
jgi:hypothetical protein